MKAYRGPKKGVVIRETTVGKFVVDDHTSVPKLDAMIARGELVFTPGVVYSLGVGHDSWCDRLNQRGDCNCDPDITLTPAKS